MSLYDLLIIGGGPAGLSAGLYGARAKLKTIILEKSVLGGMAYTTREIVNYPGVKSTTGPDLMKAMAEQAKEFGVEIIKDQIIDVELDGEIKIIKTKKGNRYEARTILLAPGTEPRMLNIPGERKLRGCGVSYCATCDAEFYQDLTVVVVGNGDAAIEEAMFIAKFAAKVIVIVIHDVGIVDCNRVSAEKASKYEKLEFVWNSVLEGIKGKEEVEAVVVKNLKTGAQTEIKAEGVFIYVGMEPKTEFLKGKVELDGKGYIVTNDLMETSVDGVYAAGDVRVKYLRQVVTSVADGAVAAVAMERYLHEEDYLNENILDAETPVLLVFWNPAEEKSIRAVAKLEQAAADAKNNFKLVKVDISRKKGIQKRYNVTKIPCALLLKKGKITESYFDF